MKFKDTSIKHCELHDLQEEQPALKLTLPEQDARRIGLFVIGSARL